MAAVIFLFRPQDAVGKDANGDDYHSDGEKFLQIHNELNYHQLADEQAADLENE